MAYVCVDKDGTEVITLSYPIKDGDIWDDPYYESWDGQGGKMVYHHSERIELPKGTIKKLIDKDISWNNEPVKLE